MKTPLILTLALSLLLAPLRAHDAGEEMAAAAKNFLSALTPEQKSKANFDFAGTERTNWHFIPRERWASRLKT